MTKLTDPVCGMTVTDSGAPAAHLGRAEYRFCCEMCRLAFIGNPGRYLAALGTRSPRDPSGSASDRDEKE